MRVSCDSQSVIMNAYDVKNVRRNNRIQHPHKLDYIFADNPPPVACIPHLALVLLAGRTGATLLTLGTVFLAYQSGSIVSERSTCRYIVGSFAADYSNRKPYYHTMRVIACVIPPITERRQ